MRAQFLQSCLTLYHPMDCSPPGRSVHGILQARILEWVTLLSSRGSSWWRDRTGISCSAGGFFITEPSGKPLLDKYMLANHLTSLYFSFIICKMRMLLSCPLGNLQISKEADLTSLHGGPGGPNVVQGRSCDTFGPTKCERRLTEDLWGHFSLFLQCFYKQHFPWSYFSNWDLECLPLSYYFVWMKLTYKGTQGQENH